MAGNYLASTVQQPGRGVFYHQHLAAAETTTSRAGGGGERLLPPGCGPLQPPRPTQTHQKQAISGATVRESEKHTGFPSHPL